MARKCSILVRGLKDDHIHLRKSGEPTWSNDTSYNNPENDAVTDRMDSGGMPELKINDHFYDKESRVIPLIKLSDDFWSWTPASGENTLGWQQVGFLERMRGSRL